MKQKAHEGLVRTSQDAETSSSWNIPGVPAKFQQSDMRNRYQISEGRHCC